MKSLFLGLAAASLSACMTLNMQGLTPAVPFPVSGPPRSPMSVAVVVPPSSRGYSLVQILPGACFGASYGPGPIGEVFAQSVVQALQPYFSRATLVDSPSSSADLIVEATLEFVGTKTACLASPEFYSEARGALRVVGASGAERWRASTTSGRAQEPMNMAFSMAAVENSYRQLPPKALAQLAASWASELASSPAVRAAAPSEIEASRPVAAPSAGGAKPWWQQ